MTEYIQTVNESVTLHLNNQGGKTTPKSVGTVQKPSTGKDNRDGALPRPIVYSSDSSADSSLSPGSSSPAAWDSYTLSSTPE